MIAFSRLTNIVSFMLFLSVVVSAAPMPTEHSISVGTHDGKVVVGNGVGLVKRTDNSGPSGDLNGKSDKDKLQGCAGGSTGNGGPDKTICQEGPNPASGVPPASGDANGKINNGSGEGEAKGEAGGFEGGAHGRTPPVGSRF